MILFLRALFIVIILSMLGVTTWASLSEALGAFVRGPVFKNPWVVATLFDAYWAFITFYVWVAWKEQSLAARLLWFISIILLGNIAMSAYMLALLFSVPTTATLTELFTRREPGRLLLPGIFTALSIAVYLLA